jgi:hypothetical protein
MRGTCHDTVGVTRMATTHLAAAFGVYLERISQLKAYCAAVVPFILALPMSEREKARYSFVESSVVLAIAYLEDFLRSLVGMATRPREQALRKHLQKGADDAQRKSIRECDIYQLSARAQLRITFKEGARIDAIYHALFRCSAWPSVEARDTLMSLALVRQIVVHKGSADVGIGGEGSYARRLQQAGIFHTTTYGDWSVHTLAPEPTLDLFNQAMRALVEQFLYLKARIADDDAWMAGDPSRTSDDE